MVHHQFPLRILVFSLFTFQDISTNVQREHHESQRNLWSTRELSQSHFHNRHNHQNGIQRSQFLESTTRDNSQETTRYPTSQEVNLKDVKDAGHIKKITRHHVENRLLEGTQRQLIRLDRFSENSFDKYSENHALASAAFHSHRQRENSPSMFLRESTTPSLYTKHHNGRRVCTRTEPTTVHHPYDRRNMRLIYTEYKSGFFCCPGWTQVTKLSFGCNKPTCFLPCQNGGVCTSPGICTCPKGFTGNQCQTDVDECLTEKPCGQLCKNLPGNYECYCRFGYQLQADGQSCRKNDSDNTAFEARDLEYDYGVEKTTEDNHRDTENEVGDDNEAKKDYEVLIRRLIKLEEQFALEKKKEIDRADMNEKLLMTMESINEVKREFKIMQHLQQEVHNMRDKLKQFELETRRVQHLTNRIIDLENRLRIRCRF